MFIQVSGPTVRILFHHLIHKICIVKDSHTIVATEYSANITSDFSSDIATTALATVHKACICTVGRG